MKRWRKRTWQVVEAGERGDTASVVFDVVILTLIVLSTIAVVAESMPEYQNRYSRFFAWFEVTTILLFTIEYIFRVWACVEDQRYSHAILGRLRFMFTPMQAIDALAIAPFYLSRVGVDLRALRLLRVMRVFRLVKLARYWKSMQLILRVWHRAYDDLLVACTAIIMLLVISATMIYEVENPAQPDAFGSIPASMWWAIATVTTVGYGEVVPITPLGKLVASFVAFLGIGLIALPTAILGSAFVQEIQSKTQSRTCPHCGKRL